MVAAAKLRRAQDRMVQTRPYAAKIQDVASRLVASSTATNPVMRSPENVKRVKLIIVGSDRGLCGGFNNNLFKEIEHHVAQHLFDHREQGTLDLVTIGKKATAYFGKRQYQLVQKFPGFFDSIEYDNTSAIMGQATSEFISGKYDEVYIAYNEFRSVIAQNRKVEKILPIDPETISGDVSNDAIDYIFEPDSSAILDQLLPLHLNMQLWKAVLESNASEQGARMSAMDSATENAKELEQTLKLKYNQARQSAITTEISEIVSGAQALGGS
jgi:F-type H+-transporting ATPase subunit gamma